MTLRQPHDLFATGLRHSCPRETQRRNGGRNNTVSDMTIPLADNQRDPDPYAQIAEWYDLEHDSFSDDIELYLELIGGATGRLAILEVGAGTGRLLAALAGAGYVVTGVEPSVAMRERCARRLAALPERVARRMRIVAGTATDLPLAATERFDVALLGPGTFGHLTLAEERAAALGALHSHLREGGRLIVDVDLAGPRRLLETAGRLWWQGAWPTRDGAAMVEHLVVGGSGAEPGIVEVTHLYDLHEQGGLVRRALARTPLALLSRGEVTLAVRQAGFSIEALYGGYDMAPADDAAGRVIVMAQRVPSA
jgi:SAM-dependent methyltransferase